MKTILIGEMYQKRLEEPLSRYFDDILWIPSNPNLPRGIAGHADLAIFQLKPNVFFVASYLEKAAVMQRLQERYSKAKFIFEDIFDPYPHDALLNICKIGHTVLFNPKSISKRLLAELYQMRNIRLIAIHQGYSRCSACCVTENSLITADPGIEKAAAAHQIDVLKIQSGFIDLPGYNTGFIGGSCISDLEQKVYFSGTLRNHPDEQKILYFLEEKGIEPVFLTKEAIFDFGSALIITDQKIESAT